MTAHRIIAFAFLAMLVVPSLILAVQQPPSGTAGRGRNGRADERKTQSKPTSEPDTNSPGSKTEKTINPAALDGEDLKLAVDLVVLDAQVLQQRTSRAVGDLKKEDFILSEDGVRQQITHFSQDTLPLSVILLIDRGGCLDPFSESVHHATEQALRRLRPQDEVALMAFADRTDLIAGFGRGNDRILRALDRVPPHDENAGHCFSGAFFEAAEYMKAAGNPDGRRVIIVITGITSYFDCNTPPAEESRRAILESGAVVCAIVPKTAEQQFENGIMRTAAGIGGLFKAKSSNLKQIADETGGEVLIDKPEVLNQTFDTLMDHLRTRYALGFVSTNTKRDGSIRKLKVELSHQPQKKEDRLIVKTRRSYIAPKGYRTNDKEKK